MRETICFDDVLLLPQYSDIESRKDISLETCIQDLKLQTPVISSPMDTVTEDSMAVAMDKLGGLGVIHRYNSCLLYTSPSPRDATLSRMPSSA